MDMKTAYEIKNKVCEIENLNIFIHNFTEFSVGGKPIDKLEYLRIGGKDHPEYPPLYLDIDPKGYIVQMMKKACTEMIELRTRELEGIKWDTVTDA